MAIDLVDASEQELSDDKYVTVLVLKKPKIADVIMPSVLAATRHSIGNDQWLLNDDVWMHFPIVTVDNTDPRAIEWSDSAMCKLSFSGEIANLTWLDESTMVC